jgi:hypothetical protein
MDIYFSQIIFNTPRKFLNNYLKPILDRVSKKKKNKEAKRINPEKLSKRSREFPSRMGWKDSGLIWEDYDKLYQP